MALSGSFNTTKYSSASHGTLGLNVSWTATQNVANNTSTIKWTVKSNGTMSSGYYVKCYKVIVKINGTKVLNTTSEFNMKGDGAYKKTGTITITHGEDGNKTVAMSAQANIYYAGDGNAQTGSKSFALNKINRYALLGEVPNFTDEENPVVPFANPAGTDMVTDLKVRLMWNSDNDATSYVDVPSADWSGGTVTLDLTSYRTALRNACPNSNTLAVKYDLMSTMGGAQYHDYKSAVMNIVNANPSPGAVTYQDIDAGVVAITGDNQVIVQLHSTLRVHTATSTANKGANIVSYKLTINGNDYTPDGLGNVDFVKPNAAGTYAAVVTTTDSRGNTATASADIPISAWSQPTAIYSFARVTDFTTNDAVLHVDGAISAVTGSSLQITESHREKGVGSWSTPISVSDDADFTIHNLDYQKEYELIITVSDSFTRADSPQTNTTYLTGISKGVPLVYFDTHRSSLAVNGIADEDGIIYSEGDIKASSVKYPPRYSSVERKVGYWIDGSAIYERTVELGSSMSLASNTWVELDTLNDDIKPLDIAAYSTSATGHVVFKSLIAQYIISTKKLSILNTRSSAISIDTYTIRYIYTT